jgi:uncharacterized membrane protein YccC
MPLLKQLSKRNINFLTSGVLYLCTFTQPLAYIESYKKLNKLIRNESLEPMFSWGFRMALSGTVPIIWGLYSGRVSESVWIALTAEAVSWVELKGSFSWRFRTLLAGAVLAVIAAVFGSVTGDNIWLGCVAMLGVGFISTLLKNIGDRASGLAICFYLLFIICNAYPTATTAEIQHRTLLIAIGAIWPVIVGVVASAVTPEQEPFRRQIALIWRAISGLAEAVSKSDNRAGYTGLLADVYAREREVRASINSSFEFHGQTAHQASQKDNRKYQLIMLRKIAGLVAVNVIAMGDEMEQISVHKLDRALRVKAAALFRALKEAADRMSVFVITMNPEERLLTISKINRLRKLTALIREYPALDDTRQAVAISRILQLNDRTINLLDNAILRLDNMGVDKPAFRSYSLLKTTFLLKPKYLLRNVQVLFNINTFTFKYALRSAIAATAGMFIYKWFNVDHGYWIPFSVMIVIQPHFGATFKKAMDRVAGTVLGVLAGGLLVYLPLTPFLQSVVLFCTFVPMVYFVKKKYAVSAFFITLNLVLLFNVEATYSNMVMVSRVLSTIGGSLLAIVAGWLLLPTWDKKLLPAYFTNAINANFDYFSKTFFSPESHTNWTRLKRLAESGNSNVFDSFNRYLQEPGREKSGAWYALVMCNVRITRALNNIHMERDEKRIVDDRPATPEQVRRVHEGVALFEKMLQQMNERKRGGAASAASLVAPEGVPQLLNEAEALQLEKIIVELRAMQVDMKQIA